MALQKSSKKKKIKNQALTPIDPSLSWPNLPHPLTSLISRNQLWRNITSFGCVTKRWRSPSTRCTTSLQSPQLIEIQPLNCRENQLNFFNCKFKIYLRIIEWQRKNRDIKEPYIPNQNMRFCNAVGFKGKVYALSLHGSVALIEEVDSDFRIREVSKKRVVPSKPCRQFREYLMESDGKILLVFLVSIKTIDVVEDVEVYRLDIEKLLWVKVEGLGDKTLFLEYDCGIWVDASKVRCKKNCVYFTHHRVGEWFVFDVESGNISSAFGSESENQEFVMWGPWG